MNWKINLLILVVTFSSCAQEQTGELTEITSVNDDIQSPYLVDIVELKKLALHPNIKIVDFRKIESYNKGHIPGAIPIWRTDIEDTNFPYGGIMASPSQIETLFSDLGLHNSDTLIVYDDNGLCDSARLWWLLQNYDFTNVKLLHGGIQAWKETGGEMSTETTLVQKSTFALTKTPSMKYYVSKEEVLHSLSSSTVLVDTRSFDEFSGTRQKEGASKAGSIPNSIHIDWANAINYNGDKKFKSVADLATIYGKITAKKDDSIIVYCHSGVRSAHTTFVLTQLLGYENVKNYDGSWLEWSYFDDLNYKKDSLTTINN